MNRSYNKNMIYYLISDAILDNCNYAWSHFSKNHVQSSWCSKYKWSYFFLITTVNFKNYLTFSFVFNN